MCHTLTVDVPELIRIGDKYYLPGHKEVVLCRNGLYPRYMSGDMYKMGRCGLGITISMPPRRQWVAFVLRVGSCTAQFWSPQRCGVHFWYGFKFMYDELGPSIILPVIVPLSAMLFADNLAGSARKLIVPMPELGFVKDPEYQKCYDDISRICER